MDVSAVISEMNGIGIQGFSKTDEAAAVAPDVIKKETESEEAPSTDASFSRENRERSRVVLRRMSAIADRISEVSVGLREHLREADTLLREMDDVSSEYRRILNE